MAVSDSAVGTEAPAPGVGAHRARIVRPPRRPFAAPPPVPSAGVGAPQGGGRSPSVLAPRHPPPGAGRGRIVRTRTAALTGRARSGRRVPPVPRFGAPGGGAHRALEEDRRRSRARADRPPPALAGRSRRRPGARSGAVRHRAGAPPRSSARSRPPCGALPPGAGRGRIVRRRRSPSSVRAPPPAVPVRRSRRRCSPGCAAPGALRRAPPALRRSPGVGASGADRPPPVPRFGAHRAGGSSARPSVTPPATATSRPAVSR